MAERVVAQHLQAVGHDVSFPATPNQEGFDLLVDGHPFQVKCLADAGGVHEHLNRFDYPVIVNSDLAGKVGHLDNVYVDPALHHDSVVEATRRTLHHGAELADFEIPWISLAVSSIAPGYRLFRGDTDLVGFATAVATNTTGRAVFALAGSKATSLAALALFGPAGGVVGAGAGAIFGSAVGRRIATAARSVFTRGEEELVNKARIELIEESIDAARPKRAAWTNKGLQLDLALTGRDRNRQELRRYITGVHQDHMQYQKARLDNLDRLRTQSQGCDALETAQDTLKLVKQIGIHPHLIQRSLKRLLGALKDLLKAKERWLTN